MMKKIFLLIVLTSLCTSSVHPVRTTDSNTAHPMNSTSKISTFAQGAIAALLMEWCVHTGKKLYKKYTTKPAKPAFQVGMFEIGDLSSASKYIPLIDKVLYDPNVKAVLIKINCPGGSAGVSETIYRELKVLKQTKPIVFFVENTCCSGGYLIACLGNIVAPHMAEIGSIGVLFALEKIQHPKSQKKEPISVDFVYAGEDKVFKHPYAPDATPEQRQHVQDIVDQDYEYFCSVVAEERDISLEDKDKWANAHVFSSPQALELGLINSIGGFNDAKTLAKQLLQKRSPNGTPDISFVEIK